MKTLLQLVFILNLALMNAQNNPSITVFKDDQLPYSARNMLVGDVIHYEIIVTNTGNVTLNNIIVTDDNATLTMSNTIESLSPGASATVTATHVITQADLDAGQYVNQATATTTFNGATITDLSDDTDTDAPLGDDDPTITFFVQSPSITVLKDDNLSYTAQNMSVGDEITYTIEVTNTGNVNLNNIEVTDNNANISGNSGIIQSLSPGASATVTATHVITQADINAGQVSNQATATYVIAGQSFDVLSTDPGTGNPPIIGSPTVTLLSSTNNISFPNLSKINIYPNPAKEYIKITSKDIVINHYQIFDISGKLLVDKLFPTNSKIDISDFNSGLYLIKFKIDKGIIIKKFFVE